MCISYSPMTRSKLPISRNFGLIKDSSLQQNDLPLPEVIDSDHWQEIFDEHEVDFGFL
ncbi:hypothetical protein N9Y42_05630 [Mariniblastus sp.]|nr:hypothetical protein [Mariniblastus sp.]